VARGKLNKRELEALKKWKRLPSFERIGQEVGKLVAEKNRAYGDSFNKCSEFLRLLYPQGVKPEQFGDMLALVRVFDKQMRIATDKDALGENPWRDVAGYGVLGVAYLGKKA
jgi:hypothetical protein